MIMVIMLIFMECAMNPLWLLLSHERDIPTLHITVQYSKLFSLYPCGLKGQEKCLSASPWSASGWWLEICSLSHLWGPSVWTVPQGGRAYSWGEIHLVNLVPATPTPCDRDILGVIGAPIIQPM